MDLAPGTIVDDRYEILHLIGEGGMGTVYQAREIGLERTIALKVLHTTLAVSKEGVARFLREGKVLSTMTHPNILRCFRLGVAKDHFRYIAMEFLDGRTLREVIDADGRLPIATCIAIGAQICAALREAERLEVVHRDLKPSNIMLLSNPEGELVSKVVDFGLARLKSSQSRNTQHLTQTGEVVGTLLYMSPEACIGKTQDSRSDIYSVGCLIYEAATGRPPFSGENPVQLMSAHTSLDAEPLAKLLPPLTVPNGFQAFLDRCMAKEPDQRYQSFADLVQDLELLKEGRGSEIAPSRQSSATNKTRRGQAIGTCAAGALVVGLICVLIRHNAAGNSKVWNESKSNTVVQSGAQRQSNVDRQEQIKSIESNINRMLQRLTQTKNIDERNGLSERISHDMRILASLYRETPDDDSDVRASRGTVQSEARLINIDTIDLSEKWEKAAINVPGVEPASFTRQVCCWSTLARGRMCVALQSKDKIEQKKQLLMAKNYLQIGLRITREQPAAIRLEDRLLQLLTACLFWCENDDYLRGRLSFQQALSIVGRPAGLARRIEGTSSKGDFCDRRVRKFLLEFNTFANPKTGKDALVGCEIMADGVAYLMREKLFMDKKQFSKSIDRSFEQAFPVVPTDGEELRLYRKFRQIFDAYRAASARKSESTNDGIEE
ncbi:MAG: serine/threonine protein kinase [Candidatus Obscuribacterales bacterium]|nr:serine/threonine protein kinase [Candidatus Obscuribacterales bacterium]